MEPLLILLASVAMVWVPTLLVRDDPDNDGLPDASPWGAYSSPIRPPVPMTFGHRFRQAFGH